MRDPAFDDKVRDDTPLPGNIPLCVLRMAAHFDNKLYDSRTKFPEVTKAQGMVEIGNDPARLRKPAKSDQVKRREAVKRAIVQTGLQTTLPQTD